MKKLFTLFFALTYCLRTFAFSYTHEGKTLNYEIVNDTACYVCAVSNVDTSGDITIPSTVTFDGYSYAVTAIGFEAFCRCSALTKITIPNSVTAIGNQAFDGCSSLTTITIPNSVTSIGSNAFYGCSKLTTITIPNSVTTISDGAFQRCSSLTEITIPSSVTAIGNSAFSSCSALTEITIPSSVTSIGNYAFWDCSSLTAITIPNSVTSIGIQAFYGCTSLTSITIPNSVTTIGESTFNSCTALTKITIPNSVTAIGNDAFASCSALTKITIPNSVTSIGNSAFYQCTSLTEITIPNSVTSIGSNAFQRCSKLTTITIPNSVKTIGDNAFSGCSALTAITIPNSVTAIGDAAFAYCSALTKITIPSSVTAIGSYAFHYCSALTKLVLMPKTPPSITSYVFNATNFTATNCIFYAPAASIDAYKSAQNYSYIADYPWSSLIDPDKVTLKAGESIQLAPTFSPDSVIWSSSDEAVATVDSLGKVTAKAVGTATITANFGIGSDDCAVTVVPTLVESITLSQSVWAGKVGESLQLTATVAPENATDKTITWVSSNENVATVDSLGNVTIVAVGTATITATSNDGSGIKAECVITATSGIDSALADMDSFDIYSADGRALVKDATRNDLKKLGNGIYILKTTAKTIKVVIR